MKESIACAQSFIAELNQTSPLPPGYAHGCSVLPVEYFASWYFDFKTVPTGAPSPQDAMMQSGGAPGFLVSKVDGKIEIISWQRKKEELEEEEVRRQAWNAVLSQMDETNWNPSVIRKSTGLSPLAALKLKQQYQGMDLTVEVNRIKVVEAMENLSQV